MKVGRVPWAQGKRHLTTTYAWFLASWTKKMSWKETAKSFQTSLDGVVRSVLTENQEVKLKELVRRCNLTTVRDYLLTEDFQWFWHQSPQAGRVSS